jgi:hypothetical protein
VLRRGSSFRPLAFDPLKGLIIEGLMPSLAKLLKA